MKIATLVAVGALMSTLNAPSFAKVTVSGPWSVTVAAGNYSVDGNWYHVANTQVLAVTPPEMVTIKDEAAKLPTDPGPVAGWTRGYRPTKLITQECTAPYVLKQSSVVVKASAEASESYVRGKDFDIEPMWNTIWRTADSSIPADATSYITYTYGLSRLDSIVIDANGLAKIVVGKPSVWEVAPPATPRGSKLIGRIWVRGELTRLAENDIYNVTATRFTIKKTAPLAATFTPKALEKLKTGQPLTILFWGDSVTAGGGPTEEMRFPHQAVRMLKKAFPKANINYTINGWGGRTSHNFIIEPSGGPFNFQEKVVDVKADLVISEFINDTGLALDMVQTEHEMIKQKFAGNGTEWVILTPHFSIFQVMGNASTHVSLETRPVVLYWRKFVQPGIGLADAAARYEHFPSEGIPFMTLMANSINHPNNWGNTVFAEAILNYFTGK